MELGKEFQRFKAGIELFREELFTELPMQQLYMLLLIAENDGIEQIKLQDMLGVSAATVSRNLKKLGVIIEEDETGKLITNGYGFVETRKDDPRKSRKRNVYLTKKGRLFIEALITTLKS